MKYFGFFCGGPLSEQLEFVEWLMQKGADLHRRQSHTFQYHENKKHETDRASSVTALHYLAERWGGVFSHQCETKEDDQLLLQRLRALTEKAKRIVQIVLTDPLPDCCNCPCSNEGCSAYTMMVKNPLRQASAHARKGALHITQAVAHFLDVDRHSLAWLRRNMLRFNTFERLQLRHTCCQMGFLGYEEVIVELDDEDDRREIREEQAEQVEKLEALLVELEEKYNEYAVPLSDFFDGYWKDRMKEISREKVPINQTELESIGVTLRETSSNTSSQSSDNMEWSSEEIDSDD